MGRKEVTRRVARSAEGDGEAAEGNRLHKRLEKGEALDRVPTRATIEKEREKTGEGVGPEDLDVRVKRYVNR